ncbi:hypothetical protein GCM10010124_12100 [Pilimelia terevasa]|uniref:Gram-positive cocci surface proteins LPxTG domain-containing protein n=1 Tax=Pilimelia terevasa TaxID=53372 RepID=A0A8J3BH88_9ACTN|nr:LPXTG cell wall anchor domain-containing protein [Pilimelia terevasa]GGK21170.1 hypothetical protein GCM10010124_12100 [Pilimelia terevasa]
MNFLSRAGAAALSAAAAATLAAGAPAAAAGGVDLAITVAGTTLAAGARSKVTDVTLVNHSRRTATGVTVAFDLGRLDQRRVAVRVPAADACRRRAGYLYCRVADVRPGSAVDLAVTLRHLAGGGTAGRLRVGVTHDGRDPRRRNNVASAPVRVGGPGADLYAYAPDAPFDPARGATGGTRPGGQATLHYAVGNAGSARATGFIVRIVLPRGATFARLYKACTYDAARRAAFCVYPALALAPEGERGKAPSRLRFREVVAVSPRLSAPRPLVGGRLSVTPLGAARAATDDNRVRSARRLADADPTDNIDELVVQVGAAAPGGHGAALAARELPLTGRDDAPPFALTGLGLLLIGAGLLLSIRRHQPR